MRSRLTFAAAALLGALLLAPTPARAFSVDDVIQMHLDSFADSLIVLKIRNSGSVFHLEMKDLHKLKEAGVSDDVVAAMLNTEKPGDVPVITGGTPLQMPPAQAPADSTTPTASTAPVTTPDAAAKPTVTPSETITTGAPYYVPRPHHYGLSDVYAPYSGYYPWYPYYSIPYYPSISFSLAFGFYGHRHFYYPYGYRPIYVFPRGGWGGGWGAPTGFGPRFRAPGIPVNRPVTWGRPGFGYGKR